MKTSLLGVGNMQISAANPKNRSWPSLVPFFVLIYNFSDMLTLKKYFFFFFLKKKTLKFKVLVLFFNIEI
jgi:hypothetical protein